MEKLIMFSLPNCPYCKQAIKWMEELKNDDPRFQNVIVDIVNETLHPEIVQNYSYYYVPTYFLGDKKLHEGIPSKEIVRNVFEAALL